MISGGRVESKGSGIPTTPIMQNRHIAMDFYDTISVSSPFSLCVGSLYHDEN